MRSHDFKTLCKQPSQTALSCSALKKAKPVISNVPAQDKPVSDERSNPLRQAVTIAICSRNRAAALQATLASLQHVAIPTDYDVELVLVDNGSTDGTHEIMQRFRFPGATVKVVREDRTGLSHARNRAVLESAGKVLLFSDDDIRFPIDWIKQMASPIFSDNADAVAGGVKLAQSLERPWATELHRSWLASTESIDRSSPERLVGANMAIRRRILEKLGGFDVMLGAGALGFAEETLLAQQIIALGGTIAPAWAVCVEHHPDLSRLQRDSYLEAAVKMGQSEGYIDHHWHHLPCSWLRGYLKLSAIYFKLWRFQLKNRQACRHQEGSPAKELILRRDLASWRFRMSERGSPLRYATSGETTPMAHVP